MESKFKLGDRVRVINYGHPMWTTKEGYENLLKFNADFQSMIIYGMEGLVEPEYNSKHILLNDNGKLTIDCSPELVGQEGVVAGSYFDLYPKYCSTEDSIERDKHQYSIDGIPGKSAWYNEDQLELI